MPLAPSNPHTQHTDVRAHGEPGAERAFVKCSKSSFFLRLKTFKCAVPTTRNVVLTNSACISAPCSNATSSISQSKPNPSVISHNTLYFSSIAAAPLFVESLFALCSVSPTGVSPPPKARTGAVCSPVLSAAPSSDGARAGAQKMLVD